MRRSAPYQLERLRNKVKKKNNSNITNNINQKQKTFKYNKRSNELTYAKMTKQTIKSNIDQANYVEYDAYDKPN